MDKSWTREDDIDIYFAETNLIRDYEMHLIRLLMPLKINFFDKNIIRFGKEKLIAISSNVKKYKVKPY